jgi:imidazolonepropionase-like amidohydrolase
MRRDQDFGTIAASMIADLVILSADPLADIGNVRRVEMVVRGGRAWKRANLAFR